MCLQRCNELEQWPRPLTTDGNFENEVFVGRRFVFKRYKRRPAFDAESRALQIYGEIGLAPRLISRCAVHLALVMTRVRGNPLEKACMTSSAWLALGRGVRRMHTAGKLRGESVPSDETWPARMASLPYSIRIQAETWRRTSSLSEPSGSSLLHGDLKPANLLVSNEVARIIDFDKSRYGDPLSDLGKFAWRVSGPGEKEWTQFSRGYFGRPPSVEEVRAVADYRVRHALGAAAYWVDHRRTAYRPHALSAAELIASAFQLEPLKILRELGLRK